MQQQKLYRGLFMPLIRRSCPTASAGYLLLPCFFLLAALLVPAHAHSGIVAHAPNSMKPHLARDLSIPIPADFDRYSSSSYMTFKDIYSTDRYISTTTKSIFPATDFNITLGGFSPATTYSIKVRLINAGYCVVEEIITFTTDEAPADEVRTLLMVIDEDLNEPALERLYSQYAQDIVRQEESIRVEKYFMSGNLNAKRELYEYILSSYFSNNLYYLFFIGSKAAFPVEIYLLDTEGNQTHSYFYQGFSFYTHVWNNLFIYDYQRDAHVLISGNNNSGTPDLYTPFRNNSAMADISFGAFIPDSDVFSERKDQVIAYFQKIRKYRAGAITYEKRALYSDTMWGNAYIEEPLGLTPRWENNIGIETSHVPDPGYHGTDAPWKASYLENLATKSFEVGWINVHGAPTFHYFGISSADIDALSSIDVGYMSLQSCSTGDYTQTSYLAGTYLNKGNVLAVEANQNVTFYVKTAATDFSQYHTLYEIAGGKKIGDAVRQHGSVFIGHMLFGDPMLIIDQKHYLTLQDAIVALQVVTGKQHAEQFLPADINDDKIVGVAEALHVMNKIGQ